MRSARLAGIALCSLALAGLAPPRALADPPAPKRAAAAPAPEDGASVRSGAAASPEATVRREAAAPGESSAGPERARKDPPRRATRRPPQKGQLARRPLDLSTPPISHVMTREQVRTLITAPEDVGPEDVMVEQGRYEAPVPRGQIRALAWALVHPLEAWRIFAPVTDQ